MKASFRAGCIDGIVGGAAQASKRRRNPSGLNSSVGERTPRSAIFSDPPLAMHRNLTLPQPELRACGGRLCRSPAEACAPAKGRLHLGAPARGGGVSRPEFGLEGAQAGPRRAGRSSAGLPDGQRAGGPGDGTACGWRPRVEGPWWRLGRAGGPWQGRPGAVGGAMGGCSIEMPRVRWDSISRTGP
jgi:hypothetical protein